MAQGGLYRSFFGRLAVINLLVDGVGGCARMRGENFCRPSSGRQQNGRDVESGQSLYQSPDNRGFARSRIALQNKTHLRPEPDDKGTEGLHQFPLSAGGRKRQMGKNKVFYFARAKLSCHFHALKVISSMSRRACQPRRRVALVVSAQIWVISP